MRLIDAEAIMAVLDKCAETPEDAVAKLCYSYTSRILKEAPAIDAVPVRHGEWVWDDAKSIYRCSTCKSPKAREDMDRKIIKEQKFCHVCGARMDGERREG